MTLGEKISTLRKKRKLTQEELAVKASVTKAAISNYENGHSSPSNDTLVAIANALLVSTDYLLGRTDDPSPSKPYYELNDKDEKDIAKDLERMLADLDSDTALAFNGEIMDEETKRLFAISLENSMRLAKEMAKKRFTPKKYRD